MDKKKQQLMQIAIQATTKKALELLGPDFDAADYKVTGASYLRLMFLMKSGTNCCYSPANHPLVHSQKHSYSVFF
ncbi:unnamed protein product [Brassica oleracea]